MIRSEIKEKVFYTGIMYGFLNSPGDAMMEEPICRIEITNENDGEYSATVQSELGGLREYRANDIETLLKILVNELQDEMDFAMTNFNSEEGSLY